MSVKLTKIIVIVVVFIAIVAFVLGFVFTIVKPPTELKFPENERFEKNIQTMINQFPKQIDEVDLEYIYMKFRDMISFYSHEGCISKEFSAKKYSAFAQKYIPHFQEFSYEKFNESVWYKSDLDLMLQRISELKQNKLTSAHISRLDAIKDIISNYNDACALVANTRFISVESVKTRLEKASDYSKMDYLTNNRQLKNNLDNYPAKLEQSHYTYVSRKIDNIDNAKYTSCHTFVNEYQKPALTAYKGYCSISNACWNRSNRLREDYNDAYDAVHCACCPAECDDY